MPDVDFGSSKSKWCPRCCQTKPQSSFHKNSSRSDGLCHYCKPCISEYAKRSASKKAYARDYFRRRYRDNPEKMREKNRTAAIKAFGMSLDEYQAIADSQGNVCAICFKGNASGRRLAIDHNHECCPEKRGCDKCVRGLLCSRCNQAIGLMREDLAIFESAIRYLEKWGSCD